MNWLRNFSLNVAANLPTVTLWPRTNKTKQHQKQQPDNIFSTWTQSKRKAVVYTVRNWGGCCYGKFKWSYILYLSAQFPVSIPFCFFLILFPPASMPLSLILLLSLSLSLYHVFFLTLLIAMYIFYHCLSLSLLTLDFFLYIYLSLSLSFFSLCLDLSVSVRLSLSIIYSLPHTLTFLFSIPSVCSRFLDLFSLHPSPLLCLLQYLSDPFCHSLSLVFPHLCFPPLYFKTPLSLHILHLWSSLDRFFLLRFFAKKKLNLFVKCIIICWYPVPFVAVVLRN